MFFARASSSASILAPAAFNEALNALLASAVRWADDAFGGGEVDDGDRDAVDISVLVGGHSIM